ncbi:FAD-dependent oxidoreductase [uncultured Acetobacterium sp.]|uniref:FAD-dependent oxidoreductase n=1 Tax=uncultured Acetobacterium sp. TaxID=217139 RepID=UPI0025D4C02E|nr:FAD-dependent oxidoreductase [uncultured Acetobacterium sp.]
MIIGGGAIGIESAIELTEKGKQVTVLEMAPDLSNFFMTASGTMQDLLEKIETLKISVITSAKLKSIDEQTVYYDDLTTGVEHTLSVDTVLLAVGIVPRHQLVDELRQSARQLKFLWLEMRLKLVILLKL